MLVAHLPPPTLSPCTDGHTTGISNKAGLDGDKKQYDDRETLSIKYQITAEWNLVKCSFSSCEAVS